MLTELKNIGLSDKEARVYLAMLELGPATILEISAKASINRPTTYVEIESLKKMGLVSTQTKGKRQLFMAESPTQLGFIIDREKKTVEQKKEVLSKVLPELTTLFNLAEEKPLVRFFEGKEGLIRMQDEFLKTKNKKIVAIASLDDVLQVFPDHPSSYTPRRVQKKIHARLIYTSHRGPFLKQYDRAMLRESKFISPEKLKFTSDLTIYDDNIAIAALKGKISGTIITHREIATSFRGLFELMWNLAEK